MLSVCLSVWLVGWLSVCLPASLPACLSVCLHLHVCTRVCAVGNSWTMGLAQSRRESSILCRYTRICHSPRNYKPLYHCPALTHECLGRLQGKYPHMHTPIIRVDDSLHKLPLHSGVWARVCDRPPRVTNHRTSGWRLASVIGQPSIGGLTSALLVATPATRCGLGSATNLLLQE